MVRYAKNSEKLYADMRSLYEDTDFPGWWYSPARKTDAAPPSSAEDRRSSAKLYGDRRSSAKLYGDRRNSAE